MKISYGFFDSIKKFLILLLLKFTYNKADLVIANSKRESEDIKLLCNCKTKFIYPPSFNKPIKLKQKKNKKNKIWNILTVGSLTKEKGLDTIIKSLRSIKRFNFKLDILGKEYDEKQNEKK